MSSNMGFFCAQIFLERINFEYEIDEPREIKIKPKSYAENFTN